MSNPMRVDTSLLHGISAANQPASLKSASTTNSFASQLKSASEKETTKPIEGQNYAEILTGPRAGMYLNTGGGARDGEAFVLVKHDGREDHIYGTGKDRKVVTVETEAEKASADEKTEPVAGRPYADILDGARKGLYLNTSGNTRDGQAFVLVKREGREYHIYGTGTDRQIFSLLDPASKSSSDTSTPTGPLVTGNPT